MNLPLILYVREMECNMKFIYVGLFFLGSFGFADLSLDSLMTEEEKVDTGYNTLTVDQKQALNRWISGHFSLQIKTGEVPLSLSINVEGGKVLILSDGSKWEVAPSDQVVSSLWLTPFPLKLVPSQSKEYPQEILNLQTQEKVLVRQVSS